MRAQRWWQRKVQAQAECVAPAAAAAVCAQHCWQEHCLLVLLFAALQPWTRGCGDCLCAARAAAAAAPAAPAAALAAVRARPPAVTERARAAAAQTHCLPTTQSLLHPAPAETSRHGHRSAAAAAAAAAAGGCSPPAVRPAPAAPRQLAAPRAARMLPSLCDSRAACAWACGPACWACCLCRAWLRGGCRHLWGPRWAWRVRSCCCLQAWPAGGSCPGGAAVGRRPSRNSGKTLQHHLWHHIA